MISISKFYKIRLILDEDWSGTGRIMKEKKMNFSKKKKLCRRTRDFSDKNAFEPVDDYLVSFWVDVGAGGEAARGIQVFQTYPTIKGESQVHVLKVVLGICMYFKNRMYFCTF